MVQWLSISPLQDEDTGSNPDSPTNQPSKKTIFRFLFPDKELWIELDGINREKKKKWLGKDYDSWIEKLDEYKIKNLNYVILYNFTEFIKYCQIVQLVQNACVTRKGSWARFPL